VRQAVVILLVLALLLALHVAKIYFPGDFNARMAVLAGYALAVTAVAMFPQTNTRRLDRFLTNLDHRVHALANLVTDQTALLQKMPPIDPAAIREIASLRGDDLRDTDRLLTSLTAVAHGLQKLNGADLDDAAECARRFGRIVESLEAIRGADIEGLERAVTRAGSLVDAVEKVATNSDGDHIDFRPIEDAVEGIVDVVAAAQKLKVPA